jgi:hypothetical protein
MKNGLFDFFVFEEQIMIPLCLKVIFFLYIYIDIYNLFKKIKFIKNNKKTLLIFDLIHNIVILEIMY